MTESELGLGRRLAEIEAKVAELDRAADDAEARLRESAAERELADARSALGEAWLSGDVSLADGIRAKTRFLETEDAICRALEAAIRRAIDELEATRWVPSEPGSLLGWREGPDVENLPHVQAAISELRSALGEDS